MPTYRVTDPSTGKTLKLTGDSPPTEAELEELFAGVQETAEPAQAAPAKKPSLLDRVTSSIIPKETQMDVASTIAGSPQAPLTGGIREALAAIPDVVRGAKEHPIETARGWFAGAAEGVMDMATPLNAALAAFPKISGLLKGTPAPPPNPLAARTGTAGVSSVPPPKGPTPFSVPAPKPAPPVSPLAKVTGTAPAPVAPSPAPVATPPTMPVAPKISSQTGGFSMKVPAAKATPPADDLTSAFSKMMGEKGAVIAKDADELLKAGKPAEAATAIEEKVRLSATELAKAMRDRYGSQRAGDMLFGNSKAGKVIGRGERKDAILRMAPGPSKVPQVVEEAKRAGRLKALVDDPRGGIDPKLLMAAGGGAAGAAAGATQGEDTQERVENALVGGAAGAIAVPLLGHALASVAGAGLAKSAQNALYTSVLSSPTSVMKAYLGAFGGAVTAAGEQAMAGNVKGSAAILTELFSSRSVNTFVKALKNPATAQITGHAQGAPTFVGRIFGAGDAAARAAMAKGGVKAEEAARYTLSGLPTTQMGQDTLNLLNKYFSMRLATSLFPRVGIQVLERGLERSPLGLLSKGLQTGAPAAAKAKAVAGPLAGAAAYAGSDDVPDWAKPYLTAVSSVYALPVGIGFAAGSMADRGKGADGQLKGGINELARNLPLPQYGAGEALDPGGRLSTLVPNLLRDVARSRDPYERKTSGEGMLARTKAKIPGLRETLPIKGAQVNVAGEPIEDRTSAFSRFLNPAPKESAPFRGIPEDVAGELTRLGVKVDPPNYQAKIEVGREKLEVPPELAEQARKDRRSAMIPRVQALLAMPAYQRLPDDQKKVRLEKEIQKANARESARTLKRLRRALRSPA